ncbi:MAG: FAD-dependent oxidoreductase [Acidimicrobiales bacterium]
MARRLRLRPRRAVASQWMSDPQIASAYAYLRAGGTPLDRDRIAASIFPGLRLAGEGASMRYPGTMHGAWISGEHAADQLIAENRAGAGRRTIVVGAGWAGIAAGRRLVVQGGSVIVLEAASFAGGRARTDHTLGAPVHLGAAWIHGVDDNPIAAIAAEADVTWEPSGWGASRTYLLGEPALDDDERDAVWTLRRAVAATVADARARASVHDALGPVLRAALAAVDAPARQRAVLECWVYGEYENLYAAPIDDLSLLHCTEPFSMSGADATLTGPLDRVIAHAIESLDVRLQTTVERIEAHGTRWSVTSSTATEEMDSVVVTAPAGVLCAGGIVFDPPLPDDVQAALEHLGAGVLAKVFFEFDEVFWQPHWAFWATAAVRPPIELWVDTSKLAGRPVLCGFATGEHARRVERMSSDELCSMAEDLLGAVPEFGGW